MNIRFIPPTTERVFLHTDPDQNENIRRKTLKKLIASDGCSKKILAQRISKLGSEWDTERVLEANAAAMALIGTYLGFRRNKSWFLIPGVVGFFLLQHALQGWCPPLPLIRKLGFRTANEIHNEKMVLKIMRGDIPRSNYNIRKILRSVEKD